MSNGFTRPESHLSSLVANFVVEYSGSKVFFLGLFSLTRRCLEPLLKPFRENEGLVSKASSSDGPEWVLGW